MKTKMYNAFAILFIGVVVSLFAADTGESLALNKCGACHKAEKLCKHIGTKDAAAWSKTTDYMIKKGAKITENEKKIIADYLAGLKKGDKPFCK